MREAWLAEVGFGDREVDAFPSLSPWVGEQGSFHPDNLDTAPSHEEDRIWKEHRENWRDIRWEDIEQMERILDREVGESGLDLPRRRKKGAGLV